MHKFAINRNESAFDGVLALVSVIVENVGFVTNHRRIENNRLVNRVCLQEVDLVLIVSLGYNTKSFVVFNGFSHLKILGTIY